MYSQQVLCDIMIPEKHFFLIEEIKNIAAQLTSHFKFIIHWIPSHIEKASIGPRPIIGNVRADTLASSAQLLATDLDTRNSITNIRHKILSETASLISNIDNLLSSNPSLRWPVFGRLQIFWCHTGFLSHQRYLVTLRCPKQTNKQTHTHTHTHGGTVTND